MYCHDKSYHSRKAIIVKCLPPICHKVNMGGYASSQHLSNRRSTMVARLFTKLEWTSSSGLTTTRPNVYRCVPPWVGCRIWIKGSSRHWNLRMSLEHFNYRELVAVLMALKSFGPSMKEKSIQILSDNVTTVAYINHLRGPNSDLTDIAKAIIYQSS